MLHSDLGCWRKVSLHFLLQQGGAAGEAVNADDVEHGIDAVPGRILGEIGLTEHQGLICVMSIAHSALGHRDEFVLLRQNFAVANPHDQLTEVIEGDIR
jgi:hypothetical protein